MQGCSKAVPKFGPPGVPSNPSTPLLPLCFQYTFLKGNNRRPYFRYARRPRFGSAWRPQNEAACCTWQTKILPPPTQEFWNLSSPIHPPRPALSRSLDAAQPPNSIPPAALASSRPATTIVTLSHNSGKNKLFSTAPSPWTASISVQLSLSQGFQPRHPPAPPTARSHR